MANKKSYKVTVKIGCLCLYRSQKATTIPSSITSVAGTHNKNSCKHRPLAMTTCRDRDLCLIIRPSLWTYDLSSVRKILRTFGTSSSPDFAPPRVPPATTTKQHGHPKLTDSCLQKSQLRPKIGFWQETSLSLT